MLRDRRLGRVFRPAHPEADWETFNWLHADSILDSEPPKHTRLRRLVAGAFGRGHVAAARAADRGAGRSGLLDEAAAADGPGLRRHRRPTPSRCRYSSSPSCSGSPRRTGTCCAPGRRRS